jgi:hypothetical protein
MKSSSFALSIHVISIAIAVGQALTDSDATQSGYIALFFGGVFLICKSIEDK